MSCFFAIYTDAELAVSWLRGTLVQDRVSATYIPTCPSLRSATLNPDAVHVLRWLLPCKQVACCEVIPAESERRTET